MLRYLLRFYKRVLLGTEMKRFKKFHHVLPCRMYKIRGCIDPKAFLKPYNLTQNSMKIILKVMFCHSLHQKNLRRQHKLVNAKRKKRFVGF